MLDAATDAELTDDESLRVRERLAAAGVVAATTPVLDCRTVAVFDSALATLGR